MAVLTDKKAKANWKRNLELHTLLIMDQEALSKADAIVQAYHEGVTGLTARKGVVAPPPK